MIGQTIGEMVAGGIAGEIEEARLRRAERERAALGSFPIEAMREDMAALGYDIEPAQYDPIAGALMESIRTSDEPSAADPDPDSNYSEIVEFTDKHAEDALYAEYITGIPATATMASIGEEFRTLVAREPWDSILDDGAWWQQVCSGTTCFNPPMMYSTSCRDSIRAEIASGEPWQGDRMNKVVDPLRIDIGPGNINFGTAMYMVESKRQSGLSERSSQPSSVCRPPHRALP